MKDPGKRLKILTNNEIQELYGLPHFFQDGREKYFYLNPLEMEELNNLRSKSSKVYFILQLGYFKAKKMFFIFSQQMGGLGPKQPSSSGHAFFHHRGQ